MSDMPAPWELEREYKRACEDRDRYFKYWNSLKEALPIGVTNKWRGNYALFYNGYWYVKRSAAEREIAELKGKS